MIGTHNTMTFLQPTNWFWRILTPWWRCQEKSLYEQIKDGVKYFDLRVRHSEKGQRWQFCHGSVNFKRIGQFHLNYILFRIKNENCKCRIILEKGDEQRFVSYFINKEFLRVYPCVTDIIVKKGWKVLYSDGSVRIEDRSYVPLHSDKPWYKQLGGILKFPFVTIKGWAKKNNVRPTWEEKDDRSVVYFYDFYELY